MATRILLRGIFSEPEPCLSDCKISIQLLLPSWSRVLANAAFSSLVQSETQNPVTVYWSEKAGFFLRQSSRSTSAALTPTRLPLSNVLGRSLIFNQESLKKRLHDFASDLSIVGCVQPRWFLMGHVA